MTATFDSVYLFNQKAVLVFSDGGMEITPERGPKVKIPRGGIEYCEWIVSGKTAALDIFTPNTDYYQISNFALGNKGQLFECLKDQISAEPVERETSINGFNCGELYFNDYSFGINDNGKMLVSIPTSIITEVQKSKNDFFVTLRQNGVAKDHTLDTVRVHVPTSANITTDDAHARIQSKINFAEGTEDYQAQINNVKFMVPRGKADIRYCKDLLYLQFDSARHKIPYTNIEMVHRFKIPDTPSEFVVISLNQHLKQGASQYQHLVIRADDDEELNIVNQPDCQWSVAEAIVRLLKQVGDRREKSTQGSYESKGKSGIICSLQNNNGYLFMTAEAFFFLHKATYIPFDKVRSIDFKRLDESKRKQFDIEIMTTGGEKYTFSAINYDDLPDIFEYISDHGMRVLHPAEVREKVALAKMPGKSSSMRNAKREARTKIREEQIFGGADESTESEEEDENFDPNAKDPSESDDSSDSDEEIANAPKSDDESDVKPDEDEDDE